MSWRGKCDYWNTYLAPTVPNNGYLAGDLSNQVDYVIHTVGPIYVNDKVSAPILKSAYMNSLAKGEEKNISSIAFPAISCGVYGYPKEKAALVSLQSVQQYLKDKEEETISSPAEVLDSSCISNRQSNYRNIDFVLYSKDILDAWLKAAAALKLQKVDFNHFRDSP